MKKPIKWSLINRKIKDLKPYSKNPRLLTKDQETHLRTSLDKFGLLDRPCINQDNTIIGGHQRINVLKKEEIESIEVWMPSRLLTEKEVEELNIRLNKNTGEWQWEILANEFNEEELTDWGFSFTELGLDEGSPGGFTDQESSEEKELCPTCGSKTNKNKKKQKSFED